MSCRGAATTRRETTIQATARHDRRELKKDLDNFFLKWSELFQIRLRIRGKKGRAIPRAEGRLQHNLNISGYFTAYFALFTD